MIMKIGSKASKPNPALEPFAALIGKWQTTGFHPYLSGSTLHGRASFEWLEGGAFLILRSEIDEPHIPHGIEIFGSDDVEKNFFMLHFDERGVSRKFDVTVQGNQITWRRDEPSFSQRNVLLIEDDGNKLISRGEMPRDGAPWEKDLELTYTRIK
jgi:hypothetical protein